MEENEALMGLGRLRPFAVNVWGFICFRESKKLAVLVLRSNPRFGPSNTNGRK
jgi:hypothetical protein